MKKRVQTSSLLGGILLSSMALIPSVGHAQICMPNQKSEVLQMREMDAFNNPDIATIPYDGKSIYKQKDRAIQAQDENQLFPIESNPTLLHKVMTKQMNSENSVDDLETKIKLHTGWGTFTNIEEGKQYYYTQENEHSFNYGFTPFYRSATFTIYNDEFEELKNFKVSSMDTVMTFRGISFPDSPKTEPGPQCG